jgi:methyl-accepting chemotaxis protein
MTTTDRIGEAADKMAAKGDALSRSTKQTAAELEDEGPSRLRDAAGTVKTGVDSVVSGASQVAERLPDLAGEARSGAASTAQTFEAMSDPTLQVVAAASLGFGTALFLTGAPRLITFVALAPAIFAAGTMIGRQQRRTEDR